jgi:hypothetical protein
VTLSLAKKCRSTAARFLAGDVVTPAVSLTSWCETLAHLKTADRHCPEYTSMPPPSGGSAAETPSAASSSARVSRVGGLSQVNYELGRSKTSWRRVKEMESLGFYPVGYGRATRSGDCS